MQTIMQVYAADPLWGLLLYLNNIDLFQKITEMEMCVYVCVGTFCYHHGPSL